MTDTNTLTPDKADYIATVYVNGLVDEVLAGGELTGKRIPNSGEWAPRFRGHPYVEQAEAEGWSRDLRAAVKAAVKARVMARRPYHEIDELMPPKEWVTHQRINAERYAKAAQWRREIIDQYGDVDAYLTRRAGGRVQAKPLGSAVRETFNQMQRASPNRGLHMSRDGELSEVSKRITGERE